MPEEKSRHEEYAPLWEIVKQELDKHDMSANKIAVLETEKIFQKALAEKNLPGKSTENKLKNYSALFSNPDKIKYARAMYKKLVSKIGFDISAQDTHEIIKGYREAIADLEKIDFKSFPAKEKISLFLKRNFYGFPQASKRIIAALVSLSLLTFFLTETETGRSVSAALVSANNYVFYQIIPTIALLIALGVLVLVALYAYQNRKK